MRTVLTIILLAAVCLSAAIIKDPRKLKAEAPLTQDQVEQQQKLQKQQGQVGLVPQKTDGTGYAPTSQDDPSAAGVLAANARTSSNSDEATAAIKTNADEIQGEVQRPKKMAFGALWALLGGLLLAVGAWAGLQKYGPKPPEHVLREGR